MIVERHTLDPKTNDGTDITFELWLASTADIIDVRLQAHTRKVAVWVLTDTSWPLTRRTFRAYEDGEEIDPNGRYVASFQAALLTWHLFEIG